MAIEKLKITITLDAAAVEITGIFSLTRISKKGVSNARRRAITPAIAKNRASFLRLIRANKARKRGRAPVYAFHSA